MRDGGDIDNRIKTLIDALRIPSGGEIPDEWVPDEGDTPLFCLLEDDKLVSAFSVTTDRLLEADAHEQDALVMIHVRVTAVRVTMGNSGLVG